jgi:RNA polymerase sigma factor (sigma-70 family)
VRRGERNRRWLAAYAAARDPEERRRWRNALVSANLAIVRSLAVRVGGSSELPLEDLVQVGSEALIRAVEAFDPERGVSLSSYVVPYVRGALRHELRDRRSLVRIPRSLWELRQREGRLQEQFRRQGRPEPPEEQLSRLLGCEPGQLREVRGLNLVEAMRSLDAPLGGADGGGEDRATLLDRLPDPASLPAMPPQENEAAPADPRMGWLETATARLLTWEHRLVRGRYGLGRTWVELAAELAIAPRQAQRRGEGLLARLRSEAQTSPHLGSENPEGGGERGAGGDPLRKGPHHPDGRGGDGAGRGEAAPADGTEAALQPDQPLGGEHPRHRDAVSGIPRRRAQPAHQPARPGGSHGQLFRLPAEASEP